MLKLVSTLNVSYNDVLNYYYSFDEKRKDLNSYAISLIKEGYDKYIDWVQTYEANDNHNMYYLIDIDNPNYLIGYGNIEYSEIFDCHLSNFNEGAIGYGIRPSERKKGYGDAILTLLIDKCNELGLSEICISCLEENIASKKIIENHNAQLEKRFYDDVSNKFGLKYCIKLDSPIKTKTYNNAR